ncbi:MAG: HAMP domain-containing histidine kinase [Mucilaginibacter polytrichastri]|nr:HAMP domain-containing histidine kinase [Mucilaginibacter polytrichastri]
MKIQTKIALLFIVLTGTVILLLSGFIFYFANRFTFEDFYARLEARVRIAMRVYLNDNQGPGEQKRLLTIYEQIPHEYLEYLAGEKAYIFLLDERGLAKESAHKIPSVIFERIRKRGSARYSRDNLFYAAQLFDVRNTKYAVVVSARDPYGLQELNHLRQILIIGFGISIIVVLVIGKVFSWQTMRPVRQVIDQVKKIDAGNLDKRVPLHGGQDEIGELTAVFNRMLDRLETAFATQNNFVSNASHELRTPITVIHGELDLMEQKVKSGQFEPGKVSEILAEVAKLEHILNSLLTLAQSGFDGKKQQFEPIRVDELLIDVKALVGQINPRAAIHLDFSMLPSDERRILVNGNVNLLRLAVSNIVINACKYSDNRPVQIRLSSARELEICVRDQGIGIPQNEIDRVFDPFFRASNTRHFAGHGVGLPLSLNIIRLHKGELVVDSKQNVGTEIRIVLPLMDVDTHV